MSRSKHPQLADLKKQLQAQPRLSASATPKQAQLADREVIDDPALFQSAVKDVRALPTPNRADLGTKPPPPVPRRKDPLLAEHEVPLSKKNEDWIPDAWLNASVSTAPQGSSEAQLLAKILQGVVPIYSDRVFIEAPKPYPVPIQHQLDEQSALAESIYAPTPLELVLEGGDELYYLKVGIPRTTLRDLRRGRWVVQAQLDLHGANRDEARDLLAAAFAHWRKRDIRCVRIIHGKGLGSPGKEPVLKRLVAGWLMNYDDVLGYCQAPVHDGGAGALLVLMRAGKR